MADLKLAKLPDRTPVKMTITLSPHLNRVLAQYADDYNRAYGNTDPEPVSELVPYILQSFLESDRAFARAQKERSRGNGMHRPNGPSRPSRRVRSSEIAS